MWVLVVCGTDWMTVIDSDGRQSRGLEVFGYRAVMCICDVICGGHIQVTWDVSVGYGTG